MNARNSRKGTALLLSMMFVMLFSALAVSMATMSGANLTTAENQQKSNDARNAAESGLEIIRGWISHVSIPGTIAEHSRFSALTTELQDLLQPLQNVTIIVHSDAIHIEPITIDAATQKSFRAYIRPTSYDIFEIFIIGYAGDFSRPLRVNFNYGERANTVFNYGVATRGPLSLHGNILLEGVNVSVEADTYIESLGHNLALEIIGNSKIAGSVSIANNDAYVDLQGGQAGIGGETGQDAIDNHVAFGVPPTEFPEPDPEHFEQWATNTYDPEDDSADVYENIRIPAGTNPHFSSQTTLRGVTYIETPNVVTFSGGVTIEGVIVGDGDWNDDSATNQLNFTGNISSYCVSSLPYEPQFEGLHDQTGTFILAPGFKASFGGNVQTVNGAIAANGIEFHGDAGGTIAGSVINYSDTQMLLSGNSDLYFNRSGLTEIPAGFVPELVIYYDPQSYAEAGFLF